MHQNTAELLPYVPDLRKHKFYMWISKYHWVPITGLAVVTLAFGGLSVMMWAVFLRTVLGLHSTWLVNSATHSVGIAAISSRRDTSTNSFWVAILDVRQKAGTTIITQCRRLRATDSRGTKST